jgi:hypothetical protein
VPLQELLHRVVIAAHVEIEHSLRVLEDEPLLQPVAAFIEAMSEIAYTEPAVRMDASERLAHRPDQLPDLVPLRPGERA